MPKKLSNNRKFPGQNGLRPDLAKIKQTEAAERQAAHDKLSFAERIAKLDLKFGSGLGAKRERARIAALTEKKNVPAQTSDESLPEVKEDKPKMKAKERHSKEKKG